MGHMAYLLQGAGAHQRVLVLAAELAQHDDHLDLRDVLVAQAVVRQRGPREHIPTDGNACAQTVPTPLPLCLHEHTGAAAGTSALRHLNSRQGCFADQHRRQLHSRGAQCAGRRWVTLIEAVGGAREDVVHLVGHAA